MTNSTCLVVAAGLMLAACGCNKEPKAPAPTQADASPGNQTISGSTPTVPASAHANLKPVNPNDSAKAQEEARMAAVLAMRRGDAPPPPALKLKGGEPATPEVLEAYNLELLRARIQERRSPESLDELVQKWVRTWRLLPRLPTPPPGKRIVYDDQNCIIRLDPP